MTKPEAIEIINLCLKHDLQGPEIAQHSAGWYVLHWQGFASADHKEAVEWLREAYLRGERREEAYEPTWPPHPLCRLGR